MEKPKFVRNIVLPTVAITTLIYGCGGKSEANPTQTKAINPTSTLTSDYPDISVFSVTLQNGKPTVTVVGQYFGHNPYTIPSGDGGVDSSDLTFEKIDKNGQDLWSAGHEDKPPTQMDSLGVTLKTWSNTKIVFGLGGSYGNDNMLLHKDDSARITVINPQTKIHAVATTTVTTAK